jgi:hypothetical protein
MVVTKPSAKPHAKYRFFQLCRFVRRTGKESCTGAAIISPKAERPHEWRNFCMNCVNSADAIGKSLG